MGLDGFIGGDHQQDEIDAADASEHVADEFFVAGNVYVRFHSGQIEKREAEVDGDTAAPFFGESIGMRAGERFHERGFSVVDMARGADNDMAHEDDFAARTEAKQNLEAYTEDTENGKDEGTEKGA